jgi:hypothetical protein
MAFMAHQPKTLIYIEFKFKMRLRLPFIPEWVHADVADWLAWKDAPASIWMTIPSVPGFSALTFFTQLPPFSNAHEW